MRIEYMDEKTLNYWVAVALGKDVHVHKNISGFHWYTTEHEEHGVSHYGDLHPRNQFSRDWALAGPMVRELEMDLIVCYYTAEGSDDGLMVEATRYPVDENDPLPIITYTGDDYPEAICRTYVAAKLGFDLTIQED